MKKDFISAADYNKEEILSLFGLTKRLKEMTKKGEFPHILKNNVAALVFEKPSLRTRVTFETAMYHLGGNAIFLSQQNIGVGKRETIKDIAKNLSRWVNIIIARTYSHSTVTTLADYGTVPVINALSDIEHPCQTYGDFFTIYEMSRLNSNTILTYIGDGNNVCNSLLLTASILGINMIVSTPLVHKPDQNIWNKAVEIAKTSGATIQWIENPAEAVKNADFIYTDVWASMGQEDEAEQRKKIFLHYQVNTELLSNAKKDYKIMHCLPAHRGEEITDEVIDGSHSIVIDEAENRLHIQKAIILNLLKPEVLI